MFVCPKCRVQLSLEEVQSHECSHCQTTWEGSPPQQHGDGATDVAKTLTPSVFAESDDEPAAPEEASLGEELSASEQPTMHVSDSLATTDFDSTDFELDDAPGESPEEQPPADALIELSEKATLGEDEELAQGDLAQGDLEDGDLEEGEAAMMTTYWPETNKADTTPTLTLGAKTVADEEALDIHTPLRSLKSEEHTSAKAPDYEVISYVAEGSMGKVFLAKQNSVQRIVAIKQLKSTLAAQARHRQKFLAEAAVTGELDHPNIVPVHDLGVSQDGDLFYSMKMIRGQSWQEEIRENSRAKNLDILLRVADAVAYAHSKNVIHRDLKPENIMLGSFGEVLVADWGVAVNLEKDKNFGLAGTPAYMAPEMAGGPPEALGKYSDVYLLGAMLFEIVVGRAPHHLSNDTRDVLIRASRNELVATDIQDELLTIAKRAMETKPSDRYAAVEQFQEAIRGYQTHTESLAILSRAEAELAEAKKTRNLESFSRAVFGFQDAIELWSGNTRAYAGLHEAKSAYAQCAYESENYELGLSLLDASDERDAPLIKKLEKGKRERDLRTRRLKIARWSAAGLVAALALVFAGFSYVVKGKNTTIEASYVQLEDTNAKLVDSKAQLELKNGKLIEQKQTLQEQQNTLVEQKDQITVQKNDLELKKEQLEGKQRDLERTIGDLEVANSEKEEQRRIAVGRKEAALQGLFVSEVALINSRITDNQITRPREQLEALKADPELGVYCDWEWDRLNFLCHPETGSLNGAPGDPPLAVVAASGDGSLLAGASVERAGSQVQLWNRNEAGKLSPGAVATARGMVARCLAISRDKRWLAVGGISRESRDDDPVLVVYRLAAGNLAPALTVSASEFWEASGDQTTDKKQGYLNAVDFSVAQEQGDRPELLAGGYGPYAVVYKLNAKDQWRLAPQKMPHWGIVVDAHFSADDSAIVTVDQEAVNSQKQGVHVWPRENGIVDLKEGRHLYGEFNAALFSPDDSSTVACAQADGNIRLWNWEGDPEQSVEPTTLAEHQDAVSALAFSPAGDRLASAAYDGLFRIWEQGAPAEKSDEMPQSGSLDWHLDEHIPSLRGHDHDVVSCQFLDEATLLSLDAAGQSRIWDLQNYYDELELVHDRLGEPCYSASFSGDGKAAVTAGEDGSVWIWPGLGEGGLGASLVKQGPLYVGHRLRPNAKFLVQPIRLPGAEVESLVSLSSLKPELNQEDSGDDPSTARASLCFWETESGRFLQRRAVGSADYFAASREYPAVLLGRSAKPQQASIWGVERRQRQLALKRLFQEEVAATVAAFRPASQEVFLGLINSSGKLIQLASQPTEKILQNMPKDMRAVAFTPDGKWLVTLQEPTTDNREYLNRALVTNVETGKRAGGVKLTNELSASLDVKQDRAVAVTYPVGREVGSAGSYATVLKLDRGNPAIEHEFSGRYLSAAIAPDGRTVLALRRTGDAGTELVTLESNPPQATRHPLSDELARTNPSELRFLGDGRLLSYGLLQGRPTANVWDLEAGADEARMTSGSAVLAARLTPDKKKLVSIGRNGVVYVWKLDNAASNDFQGEGVLERQIVTPHVFDVRRAALSPAADVAVLIDRTGAAVVVDVTDGKLEPIRAEGQFAVDADCSAGEVVILFSDGRIWQRAGGAGNWIAAPEDLEVQSARLVRLSADGKALAARVDKKLVLWRRKNGAAAQWEGPLVARKADAEDELSSGDVWATSATALAFSASKQRLIVGDGSGSLSVLQLSWPGEVEGQANPLKEAPYVQVHELFRWKAHKNKQAVLSVDFSADGRQLVSTSEEGNAKIWPSLPEPAPHGNVAGKSAQAD